MADLKRFLVPWIDQVKSYNTDDLLVAWSSGGGEAGEPLPG
jgi:hypothetical protein